MSTENQSDQQNSQPEFSIQRIYTKDISYESPNTPDIFQIEWAPKVDLNLNTDSKKLSDDVYEVTLQVTVTVKLKDQVAFLAEIKQAGIFTLKGFAEDQIEPMLGSFCPNIIFPYARELISETIARGNFPPLYLAPVNFDAFYQDKMQQEKK